MDDIAGVRAASGRTDHHRDTKDNSSSPTTNNDNSLKLPTASPAASPNLTASARPALGTGTSPHQTFTSGLNLAASLPRRPSSLPSQRGQSSLSRFPVPANLPSRPGQPVSKGNSRGNSQTTPRSVNKDQKTLPPWRLDQQNAKAKYDAPHPREHLTPKKASALPPWRTQKPVPKVTPPATAPSIRRTSLPGQQGHNYAPALPESFPSLPKPPPSVPPKPSAAPLPSGSYTSRRLSTVPKKQSASSSTQADLLLSAAAPAFDERQKTKAQAKQRIEHEQPSTLFSQQPLLSVGDFTDLTQFHGSASPYLTFHGREKRLPLPQGAAAYSLPETRRPVTKSSLERPADPPHKEFPSKAQTFVTKERHDEGQKDSPPRRSTRIPARKARKTARLATQAPASQGATEDKIGDKSDEAENMGVIRKKTAVRGGEGGTKYHCNVCSVDVTSTVRIRCAHSACNEYDLCVNCFAAGEHNGTHKPESHPYHVIEQNSFPIYDEDWGADEELLLIEGAEMYGLGSWADIADHIGGFRTKDEVRDHYLKAYVQSDKFPLPEHCSPHDTDLMDATTREEFQAKRKARIEERKEEAKSAPALQPKTKPTASVPSCHEIQGYMPGRLEFETEHANEAEEAVQHMQFEPGEGVNPQTGQLEPEMELKMTVMDIYNDRLTQRVDRKKVIFEHNLLDYRENTKQEKKRSKEERDIILKCKPLMRIMNKKDWETFVEGLIDEHNLRQAITQLQHWRQMGIASLSDGEKYEQEKAARAQKAVPMGSMDRERLASAQRNKQPVANPEPPSGVALLVAPELPIRLAAPLTEGVNVSQAIAEGEAAKANGTLHAQHEGARDNGSIPFQRPRFTVAPIPGITPMEWTMENAPDLHLLTPEEARLCEVCRLQPKPYIMLKEQIMKEAIKVGGYLKKKNIKELCRLDPAKCARIFEFFVTAGWIGKA